MGVLPTTRDVRFFSCASNDFTRCGAPSATRITPGRPITRCTASRWVVPTTPWLTRQAPRMLSSAHPAAPGWPSALEYTELCTRRPKIEMAMRRPTAMPSGRSTHSIPKNSPMPNASAEASTIEPIINGSRSLSSRRCCWNACQSCLYRIRDAARFSRFAAFCASLSALAGFPAMPVRIALAREERGSLLGRGTPVCQVLQAFGQGLAAALLRLRVEPPRPVRRAHQRARHHARESHLLGGLRVRDELLGLDPPFARVVARGRAQVLRDLDDLATRLVQVGERGGDLVG